MLRDLQSWSISENPNGLYPAKKSEDSTEMKQVFWGRWSRIGLTEAHQPAAFTFLCYILRLHCYFRDLWWLRLGHISLFPLQKKKLFIILPITQHCLSSVIKQRESCNLNLHSSEVNGFVSWSNTVCCVGLLLLQGGCLHGGHLRDPERRQRSWLSPRKNGLRGWAAFHPLMH